MISSDSNTDVVARIPDSGESPDHALARTQMRNVLEQKVDELPEILRVVFVLRSVEELSVEETADSLAIPQETVRTRHFRAKAMLRESLAKEVDLAEGDIFRFGGVHCDGIVTNVLACLAFKPDACSQMTPFSDTSDSNH